MPVSCTHLDVYKRQVEYYDASLRDQKARDTAVSKENVKNLERRRQSLASVDPLLAQEAKLPPVPRCDTLAYNVAGIDPVAYTHLDVYKRQGRRRALFPQ